MYSAARASFALALFALCMAVAANGCGGSGGSSGGGSGGGGGTPLNGGPVTGVGSGEERATATLDQSGGVVTLTGGADLVGATLTVPPGALTARGVMRFQRMIDLETSTGLTPMGPCLEYKLGRAVPLVPATVKIPYDPARLPPGRTAADVGILLTSYVGGTTHANVRFLQVSATEPGFLTTTVAREGHCRIGVFDPAPPTLTGASLSTSTSSGVPIIEVAGGQTVTIEGTHLFQHSVILWNGTDLTTFTYEIDYVSRERITFKTPRGSAGTTVTVSVRSAPGVTVSLADAFRYRS